MRNENGSWMKRDKMSIENIETRYEDTESVSKLDVTFRCQKHVKNCALQNVFKI